MSMESPLPMLLFCPACGLQHFDAPDPANGWENPPHRSHLCSRCGHVWRPADVPTAGVISLATQGADDTKPAILVCMPIADELARLKHQLSVPEIEDFLNGANLEAAHQRERWGVDHDAGKAPADWFWLIGHLAGKALHAAVAGDLDKTKHHCVSATAVLLNWHLHLRGVATRMRPGIAPPQGTSNV